MPAGSGGSSGLSFTLFLEGSSHEIFRARDSDGRSPLRPHEGGVPPALVGLGDSRRVAGTVAGEGHRQSSGGHVAAPVS
jgi:hypothetical protein